MKAITFDQYGSLDNLLYHEVPDPTVGPDGVLVKIMASSVNPVDWKMIGGKLAHAYDVWFPAIPGWDVTGTVLRIGPAVQNFMVGDEVIGYVRQNVVHHGSYAELIAVPESMLSLRPKNLSWPESGALPLIGLTAYQTIYRILQIQSRETVLIHGASGGLGAVCIQLLHHLGARVLGTCHPDNAEKLLARNVIPISYLDDPLTEVSRVVPEGIDAIIALVTTPVVRESTRLLRYPDRVASVVDPEVIQWPGEYVAVRANQTDMDMVSQLAKAGVLFPEVHQVVPLCEVKTALEQNRSGVSGKIAIYPIQSAIR